MFDYHEDANEYARDRTRRSRRFKWRVVRNPRTLAATDADRSET